jgi:hypothetical protein
VQVLLLEETDPSQDLRLTGSTVSWRTEEIAFEVGGRVAWIVEEGTEVYAPWGEGKGDEVARLDDRRYLVAVDAAKAAYDSAVAEQATLQAELDHVIPANMEAAKATTNFRRAEVTRYQEAIKTNAVSKSDLDEKQAALRVSIANEKEIEANGIAITAKIKSAGARSAVENENIRQARINLDDCVMRSPYPAKVEKVHTIPGAVVAAGEPACTLTVMNPIKVVVSISEADSRKVKIGDAARIFPPHSKIKMHSGSVFNKSTTADPNTRTFDIELITRNYKLAQELPDDPAIQALPRVSDLFYPLSISSSVPRPREKGAVVSNDEPWFLNENCIYGDETDGYFVWRVKGQTRESLAHLDGPVLTIEKVTIKLGTEKVNAFGLYKANEVERDGSIKATDIFAAVSQTETGMKTGDQVAYVREEWLFRPGALVPVELDTVAPSKGLFVPMKAIQKVQGGGPTLFVVNEDPEGGQRVKQIDIKITATVGEMMRVEGAGIAAGAKVVLDGAHYLVDGDAVSIAEEVPSK